MYMYLRNPYQNINHIIRSSETRLQPTRLCQFQIYGEVRSLCIILKVCTIKLRNITELFLANQIHSSLARRYECLLLYFFFVQFSIKSSLDCVNTYNDWQCHVWATQGECEINPDFMKVSCKRACRVCGNDEEQLGGMQFAQTH